MNLAIRRGRQDLPAWLLDHLVPAQRPDNALALAVRIGDAAMIDLPLARWEPWTHPTVLGNALHFAAEHRHRVA